VKNERWVTVSLPTSTDWCYLYYYENKKYTYDVRVRHVLIFGILDTSQTFTPFNPLRSQNLHHNLHLPICNEDRCYDILQHLIRICMSTEASVIFQALHQPTLSNIEINYGWQYRNKTCLVFRSDKAVVLWVEGQGWCTHEGVLSPSHKFRVLFKGIGSSYIGLTNVLLGHGHRIFTWLRVARWRRCPFCFNCQNIQNKVKYKINLKSITNFAGSNSAGGMDVCSFGRCVLSGTHHYDGSFTNPDEIYNMCVCVRVCVC
jgi:hypothetical protein